MRTASCTRCGPPQEVGQLGRPLVGQLGRPLTLGQPGLNDPTPLYIHSNGRNGISVESGLATVEVMDAFVGLTPAGTAAGNCLSATGACGGIVVLGGSDTPVDITRNVIVDTQGVPASSQGFGIAVNGGDDHTITDNHVGLLADGTAMGNLGVGIGVMSGFLTTGVLIEDNEIGANGSSGVLLSTGSSDTVVSNNRIGVDPTGLLARGNGGHGVKIFASDDNIVELNIISDNTKAGVHCSGADGANWHSGGTIQANTIGTSADGVMSLPNGTYGVYSSGQEGGYLIGGVGLGNLISGHPLNGLRLLDPGHTVHGNNIGSDGTFGSGNGTSGFAAVWLEGDGIVFGDDVSPEPDPASPYANLVGLNAHHGVVVGDASGIQVLGNLIGIDRSGTASLSNSGHGVVVRGGPLGEVRGNVVATSALDGVLVSASDAVVDQLQISGNTIGEGLDGSSQGNTAAGIRVLESTNAITNVTIEANAVAHNGDVGIEVDAAQTISLLENSVSDNGLCAYSLLNGANGGAVAGEITVRDDGSLTGLVPAQPSGFSRVDVFYDPGDEARDWLGTATLAQTAGGDDTWVLAGVDHQFPTDGRISAIVTLTDGSSSGIGDYCLDGCSTNGPDTCNDGDPCTTDTCDLVDGCVTSPAPGTTPCSDGDSCTAGDQCNLLGDCIPGPIDPLCPVESCQECVDGIGCVDNPCSDDDLCTIDSCDPTLGCQVDGPTNCSDGDDCSEESCDPALGCEYLPRAVGFVCRDLDQLCEGWGECDAFGDCVNLGGRTCALENGCGNSTCDNATGQCSYITVAGDGQCDPSEMCEDPVSADCFPVVAPFLDGDADGDGIPNEWEVNQQYTDCAGNVHLLPADLDPNVPNVLLEVDYMDDVDHTHDLEPGVKSDLELAFADAGVVLTLEVGDPLTHHNDILWAVAPDAGCDDWGAFYDYKEHHFERWKAPIYHYLVMAHSRCGTTSSGVAEPTGNDLIVSIHDGPTMNGGAKRQRNTIMHELGHNLGKSHGGPGGINFKPNYQSVMSYRFQNPGLTLVDDSIPVDERNKADYSYNDLMDLDENAVDEQVPVDVDMGVGFDGPEYLVRHNCPPAYVIPPHCATDTGLPLPECSTLWTTPIREQVDFNCNGVFDTALYAQNLNKGSEADLKNLVGHDDWASLVYDFQCNTDKYDDGSAENPPIGELTKAQLRLSGSTDPDAPVRIAINPICGSPASFPSTGYVQAAVYGRPGVDLVGDLEPQLLRLHGALADSWRFFDEDGDGEQDLVYEVDMFDVTPRAGASVVAVYSTLATGEVMVGTAPASWGAAYFDSDGDHVRDACDSCPTVAATIPSLDGCN